MTEVLVLQDVHRDYTRGAETVHALGGVSLAVGSGQMVALMGPSGSGKSTALLVAALLLSPTSGQVQVAGRPAPATERERARLRNSTIGFIQQQYPVVEDLTALANVSIPLEYRRPLPSRAVRRKRSAQALRSVGLGETLLRSRADTLSGGQRQRMAIARALANDPALLLADEPTAALDSTTAQEVVSLFRGSAERGCGVLVATHDLKVAAQCDRVVRMSDGLIEP